MRSVLVIAAVAAAVRVAAADTDIEKADKLFEEARALQKTDPAAACAKFSESLHFNPQAIGTLLNVALCDETAGRTASAFAKFSEARDRAKEQQLPEYITAAEDHLKVLEPQLSYVAITVAEQLPGMKILIDDVTVDIAKLARHAIDPGPHELVVSAPDRLPYSKQLQIGKHDQQTIAVPALARSVTVNKVVRSSRRTIGKITLAAGGVAAGTGLVLGLVARSRYNGLFDGADPACMELAGGAIRCSAAGHDQAESAYTLGNVGTVVGIVGLAAVATGAVLWFTAPQATRETRVGIVPSLGPDGGGLAAFGRF